MVISFFTRYATHHVLPWCERLYELTDGNFYLIETEAFPQFRIDQGYEDWGRKLDWCINAVTDPDGEEKALALAVNSDVVIFGGGSYRYQDLRFEDPSKLSFKMKERLYKDGFEKMTVPDVIQKMYKKHGQYVDKNLYYLCAGTYTAYDVHYQGFEEHRLLKWGYFPPTTIHDLDKFSCVQKNSYEMLWIGNMESNKMPEVILPVLKSLRTNGYPVNLTYIGSGEHLEMLKKTVSDLNIQEYVTFQDNIPWYTVREKMYEADICLCTSNYAEGWGAVISESMNEGCITVASYASGASCYLIENGKNGFLYEHENPAELESVLAYIIDHFEEMGQVRKNAYRTLTEEWTGKNAGERLYHTIYHLSKGNRLPLYPDGICSMAPLYLDSAQFKKELSRSNNEFERLLLIPQDSTKPVFIGSFGEYTRGDLYKYSKRFAALLEQIGVTVGENVGLMAYDSIEMIEAFWGTFHYGAVSVVLSTLLKDEEIFALLDQTNVKTVAISQSIYQRIQAHPKFAQYQYILLDAESDFNDASSYCWNSLRKHDCICPPIPKLDNEKSAFIFFTSGTTGQSKAVICKRSLIENSEKMFNSAILHLNSNDVIYSTSKMFVMYGMSNTNYGAVTSGAKAVIDNRFSTIETILENIQKYRPTVLYSIPTIYERILNYCANNDVHLDLSSVRLCVSGGEPLGHSIGSRWKKTFGIDILEGIGGTEAGHFYISNRLDDIEYGSVGYPLEHCELSFINEESCDNGDVIGTLVVKSPNVSHGYYGNDAETKRKFFDGKYITGDVFRKDIKGRYWFLGRDDDLLKISGIWISPIQIEDAIKKDARIEGVLVSYIGKANETKRICAVIVPNRKYCDNMTSQEIAQMINENLRQSLEHIKCPKAYIILDTLPTTGNGKINRHSIWKYINENEDIQSKIIWINKN